MGPPPHASQTRRFQVARQVEVIVLFDGLQGLVVDFRRLVVRVIVGKVGAGHDQRIGSLHHLGQRHPQRAAGLVALIAHDDGHELELPEHALQEGQLDLDGMLRVVRRWRVPGPDSLMDGLILASSRREMPGPPQPGRTGSM